MNDYFLSLHTLLLGTATPYEILVYLRDEENR